MTREERRHRTIEKRRRCTNKLEIQGCKKTLGEGP
jgi:hypothetical protein